MNMNIDEARELLESERDGAAMDPSRREAITVLLAHLDTVEGQLGDLVNTNEGRLTRERDRLRAALHARGSGPRQIAGTVDYQGATELTPDVERWRAILQARADATGFEHAIIDIERDGENKSHPRFTLCWPTGDEQKLADIVVEAFAHTLRIVHERDQADLANLKAEHAEVCKGALELLDHITTLEEGYAAHAASCRVVDIRDVKHPSCDCGLRELIAKSVGR